MAGVILILIIGCSAETCKAPMAQIGSKCCVDIDDNGICDLDENKITGSAVSEEIVAPSPVKIEAEPEEPKEAQEKQSFSEPQKPEVSGEPTVKVETPKQEEPDTATYIFIKKYENKGLGYQYIYNKNWNKVKEDRIRINLELLKKIGNVEIKGTSYSAFYIDTIYLNRKNQEALGYCERDRYCFSEGIIDVPLRLNYEDYKEKTPDEWLYEYALKEPDLFEERKYYVKGRQTSRATYKLNNGERRIYYDLNTGLPVRIETQIEEYPTEIIEYRELTSGTVRDVDVIHRSKDEIPPEEVFYSTRS